MNKNAHKYVCRYAAQFSSSKPVQIININKHEYMSFTLRKNNERPQRQRSHRDVMFAPFSCDVDRINNERQIVLRKRNYVVALKGLIKHQEEEKPHNNKKTALWLCMLTCSLLICMMHL